MSIRKIIGAFLLVSSGILMLTACGAGKRGFEVNEEAAEKKVKVTATLFPQYDFARAIGGDKVEVSMLLPPGAESHNYEPSPSEIISAGKSELFIYTGEYMEVWAESIVEVLPEEVYVLNVSQGIDLRDYNTGDDHEDHDDHEEHRGHEGHMHNIDPHIWTDPVLAVKMAENIYDALCEIDGENAIYYKENLDGVVEKLNRLDNEFKALVSGSENKFIVFGGRFAFNYFVREYGLGYVSAYDSCSAESEPSAAKISSIIEAVREKNVKVVFYEELTKGNVADIICEETGAEKLLLHSCHNISAEDFSAGVTYFDLMENNLENLKRGLD